MMEDVRIFRGIRFLRLRPVIHSANKADGCTSQSHGRGKKKLEEESILKFCLLIRARNLVRRLAMLLKTILRKCNNNNNNKPQQKSP